MHHHIPVTMESYYELTTLHHIHVSLATYHITIHHIPISMETSWLVTTMISVSNHGNISCTDKSNERLSHNITVLFWNATKLTIYLIANCKCKPNGCNCWFWIKNQKLFWGQTLFIWTHLTFSRQLNRGQNSSVGSVFALLSCMMQLHGLNPPLSLWSRGFFTWS